MPGRAHDHHVHVAQLVLVHALGGTTDQVDPEQVVAQVVNGDGAESSQVVAKLGRDTREIRDEHRGSLASG